jgi:hypothetical protein
LKVANRFANLGANEGNKVIEHQHSVCGGNGRIRQRIKPTTEA